MHVTESIRGLKPYQPGKPIEETKREFGLDEVVKLASNENPLGPSPLALKAIAREAHDLHRYPDGSGFLLKQALSRKLGVTAREIVLGNGSNDVIDFAVRAYTSAGDFIAQPEYSFIAYSICGLVHGVKTVQTPIDPQTFQPDLMAAAEILKRSDIKIFFLANPNNPTGAFITRTKVLDFLKSLNTIRPHHDLLVVLDYAYSEYLEQTEGEESLPEIHDCLKYYPNVVITKTFSKIYGLGGLRVGYLYGPTDLIEPLEKVRQPFNVSSLALAGCEAALTDQDFVRRSLDSNRSARTFWEHTLAEHQIRFVRGLGNFILARSKEQFGLSGIELFEKCLQKGLILRPVSNYGLHDWIRISFGTEAENHFAWKILKPLLSSTSARAERKL